jgi:hypothetical protein
MSSVFQLQTDSVRDSAGEEFVAVESVQIKVPFEFFRSKVVASHKFSIDERYSLGA